MTTKEAQHLDRPLTKEIAVTHLIHDHGSAWTTRKQLLKLSWEELDLEHETEHQEEGRR